MSEDPFPTDMDPWMKLRLHFDMGIFGTAFYEQTAEGYERLDPTDVIVDHPDGPPGGVEMRALDAPTTFYGTPPVEPEAVAEHHDIPFRPTPN